MNAPAERRFRPADALSAIVQGVARDRLAAIFVGLIAIALLLPVAVGSQYVLHIAVLSMIYVALALGLNIIVSCGLLDLGYIAFFAIGAYAYAILNSRWHLSMWLSLPFAVALCFAAGLILAIVSLRSRSDYFALLTLAFGEIVRLFLRNADSLTNGPQGIMNLDRPTLFFWSVRTPLQFYYFTLAFLFVVFVLVHRISISRIGSAWLGARDNEIWLSSASYHVLAVRVSACVLGALAAGVSGVLFASWQTFVAPESFVFLESILVLCMVILGGGINGNLLGVLLGAALLTLVPELFRGFQIYRMMALGLVMLFIPIFRSSGLIGTSWLQRYDRAFFARRPTPPESEQVGATRARPNACEALTIRDVVKSFAGVIALGSRAERDHGNGFSFTFKRSVIYGIIGLNGAGKTTLFNCIRGLCAPDHGEIRVDEKILYSRAARSLGRGHRRNPPHRAAQFVGTTFQTCSNQETMPAWKNVYLALRPLSTFRAIAKEFAPALFLARRSADVIDKERARRFLVEAVAFPEARLEMPVGELSFAERRKVELAKAFAADRPIVLLDEPTAGLTDDERRQFIEIIKSLSADKIVAVIEHNYVALGELADQIIYMENGNIGVHQGREIVGSHREVMANEHVRTTYLGALTATAKPEVSRPAAAPALAVQIGRAGYTKGAPALRDVEMKIPRGAIVGIMGVNGSGKSTLLRCLVNSEEVKWIDGTVTYHTSGCDLALVRAPRRNSLSTSRIAREGVVLVRQEEKIFKTMSVLENLRFYGAALSKTDEARSAAALKWFCENVFVRAFFADAPTGDDRADKLLKDILARPASQLSGGQQQLLAFGRALVAKGIYPGGAGENSNVVLLFDEPTAGLQPSLARVLLDNIRAVCDACGCTALITGEEAEISSIADEVYKMEVGRLSAM